MGAPPCCYDGYENTCGKITNFIGNYIMFQPLFGRVFVDVLEGNDLWWFSQQKRYASSAIICKIPPIPSTRVHHPYWALQHHFQTPQNHILSRFLAFQYNYISINCDICIISMNIAIRYIYIPILLYTNVFTMFQIIYPIFQLIPLQYFKSYHVMSIPDS